MGTDEKQKPEPDGDGFDAFLRRAVEGCDEIHVGQHGAQLIQQLGGKLDPSPPPMNEEEKLDAVFAALRADAKDRSKHLPPRLREALPAIEGLHNQALDAALFGLNGAAITLAAILVEFVLKHCCFITECGGYPNYSAEAWSKYEDKGMTLHPAAERACALGLITAAERDELIRFKETIRNPYGHYNIGKITEGVVFGQVKVVDFESRTVELRDIPAKDSPVLQPRAKDHVDAADVWKVLWFADMVTRTLLERMHERLRGDDPGGEPIVM